MEELPFENKFKFCGKCRAPIAISKLLQYYDEETGDVRFVYMGQCSEVQKITNQVQAEDRAEFGKQKNNVFYWLYRKVFRYKARTPEVWGHFFSENMEQHNENN
jgi:hypothetical protein